MNILKLDEHDEEREIEFNINFFLSKSIDERFKMMFAKRKEILNLLKEDGDRGAFCVIKRAGC